MKGCAAEPTSAVERDVRAGASIAAYEGTTIGAAPCARSFVAAETASGLACFPDLSPAAYESLVLCLQGCLPLTAPICFSVCVPSTTGPGFHFGSLLSLPDPILSVVSAQVFCFGLKSSFLGKARDLLAKSIAALRLNLTDLRA